VNPWPKFSKNGARDRDVLASGRSRVVVSYILCIAHALTTGGMSSSVVKSTQTARCCVYLKHDLLLFRRPCQRRIACSSLPPARSPCSSPSVVLRSSAHSTPGSPPCVRLSFVLACQLAVDACMGRSAASVRLVDGRRLARSGRSLSRREGPLSSLRGQVLPLCVARCRDGDAG
jgi:hypothetical protein